MSDVAPPSPGPGPYVDLPPPDRVTSRYTGWTRQHWLAVADHLLEALPSWATADGAQYRLPGRTSVAGAVSDGVEGYARSFLLAAYRMAAEDGPRREQLVERYSRGLLAGTDPHGANPWPALTDRSQQIVEAAAVAVALHESRAWLWDALSEREQEPVLRWLGGAVGIETHPNNWLLFRTVIQQFLAANGAEHRVAEIEYGLDAIDEWYLGDGWYTDGDGRKLDYYNAFAMHYYPLIWSTMVDDDGGRGAVYRERLRSYLDTFQLFVGRDGAPVFQGRSLTYRYGMLAPFWLGARFDASPLTPGRTRRLCSGVLRHFTEHGVPDGSGLLTLGWYGSNLAMTQPYSGPGSPYWASKGFAGLALGAEHAVWTDPEAGLIQDTDDVVAAVAPGGWLLHHTHDDGIVRLINHGSDHNDPEPAEPHEDPLYNAIAYSNVTSPDLDAHRSAAANHVWLSDGTHTTRRRRVVPSGQGDGWASSRYHDAGPDGEDVCLDVVSVVWHRYEIRVVCADSPWRAPVFLGGFALGADPSPDVRTGERSCAAVDAGGLTSAVVALHGFERAEAVRGVQTSVFGDATVLPQLSGGRTGDRTVHVALVALSGQPVALDILAGATVDVDDGASHAQVRIGLPDGQQFEIELGRGVGPAVTVTATAGGGPVSQPPRPS